MACVPSAPLWHLLDMVLMVRHSVATLQMLKLDGRQMNKNNTLFQNILKAMKKKDVGDVTRR